MTTLTPRTYYIFDLRNCIQFHNYLFICKATSSMCLEIRHGHMDANTPHYNGILLLNRLVLTLPSSHTTQPTWWTEAPQSMIIIPTVDNNVYVAYGGSGGIESEEASWLCIIY